MSSTGQQFLQLVDGKRAYQIGNLQHTISWLLRWACRFYQRNSSGQNGFRFDGCNNFSHFNCYSTCGCWLSFNDNRRNYRPLGRQRCWIFLFTCKFVTDRFWFLLGTSKTNLFDWERLGVRYDRLKYYEKWNKETMSSCLRYMSLRRVLPLENQLI